MQKTQASYLPAEAAAMLDMVERDHAARNVFQRPRFDRPEAAAEFILGARRYLPVGHPHLAAAADALAGIWSPGELADRPDLPPVELELLGVFSSNGRRRLVHRITVEGQEVGTAAEWPDRDEWRLSVPGHCANLRQSDRSALLATVARILSTGSLWS